MSKRIDKIQEANDVLNHNNPAWKEEINWLIEQAEKVEQLEKELEEIIEKVCKCGFPFPPQPVNRPMSGKLRQVTKDCIKCGKSNTWKYRQ